MIKKQAYGYNTFMEIVWEDASSNDGWSSQSDDHETETVITRGWVVKQTDKSITLAGSVGPTKDDTFGSTQTIPCGMIVSKRELKVTSASSKSRYKIHPEPSTEEVHREPSKG